jgi:competence protein ComEA
MSGPPHKPLRWPTWSLRWSDQRVAAAFLCLALIGLAGHWAWHRGQRRRLIDVDRAPIHVAKFQIDINQADWPEFALLPRIGEVLAKRIVADREANGPFRDWNDLRRVRGIGPKTFEGIQPYLQPMADLNATAGP